MKNIATSEMWGLVVRYKLPDVSAEFTATIIVEKQDKHNSQ
jgi:hypothetical protein